MQAAELRKKLIERFPNVVWSFNEENIGFAGGVTQGLQKASGDICLLLNVDVVMLNSIEPSLDYLRSNPEIGLVGPQILDKKGKVQDSARDFMDPKMLVQRTVNRLKTQEGVIYEEGFDYQKAQAVDWVIGATMLLKREVLAKVGGMDTKYFLYVEDMDWCKRIWEAGFEVHYYPDWKVEYAGDRKSTVKVAYRSRVNRHTFYHLASYLRFLLKFGRGIARKSKDSSS